MLPPHTHGAWPYPPYVDNDTVVIDFPRNRMVRRPLPQVALGNWDFSGWYADQALARARRRRTIGTFRAIASLAICAGVLAALAYVGLAGGLGALS